MLKVSGVGRLSKDVELQEKNTKNGEMQFCKMNIAFDNGKDKPATFVEFDVWGKNAENASKFLEKGSQVYIEGVMTNNNYEKDGQMVYTNKITANEIQYLSSSKNKETSKGESERT